MAVLQSMLSPFTSTKKSIYLGPATLPAEQLHSCCETSTGTIARALLVV